MGAPMCRNLAAKGHALRAFDSDLETLAQLDESGVTPAESVRDVAEHADIIFLSLPGGTEVNAVCLGAGSLLTHLKPGGLVVDLSTTPVNLARDLARQRLRPAHHRAAQRIRNRDMRDRLNHRFRRDVQNPPPAALAHIRQHYLGEAKKYQHHRPKLRLPNLRCDPNYFRRRRPARIVEQDIDRSQFFACPVRSGLDR